MHVHTSVRSGAWFWYRGTTGTSGDCSTVSLSRRSNSKHKTIPTVLRPMVPTEHCSFLFAGLAPPSTALMIVLVRKAPISRFILLVGISTYLRHLFCKFQLIAETLRPPGAMVPLVPATEQANETQITPVLLPRDPPRARLIRRLRVLSLWSFNCS
jgi:hypothetical protein